MKWRRRKTIINAQRSFAPEQPVSIKLKMEYDTGSTAQRVIKECGGLTIL